MAKTYYEILGVPQTATKEEIARVFRKRSVKEHPDKGGDTSAFQELSNAYSTLVNEETRKQYDEMLWSSQSNFSSVPKSKSPSFFSSSKTTAWDSEQAPQWSDSSNHGEYDENIHAYFFQAREDVFYPSNVRPKNFMPFLVVSPLEELFILILEGVTVANNKKQTEKTSQNDSSTEENKAEPIVENYTCGKGENFVYVTAPSREEMADLIVRTLILQAVLFTLLTNQSQFHSGLGSRDTGHGPTVIDVDTQEELSSPSSFKM